jgi:hypothetical protein
MADHLRPIVIDRREADRRLDLRDGSDRRQAERRDLDSRPADLRADDVVIDLREGQPQVQVLRDVEQVLARRWFLLAILGALNLLDLVTTKMVLNAGGAEANPLKACPPRSAIVDRALVFVTVLYTAIVSWNLVNLLVSA